ncbi:hypothetical protein HBI56_171060 [Parastagonospora nodorum]|uniref:Uncharacterized protein n=1 Tax=Phaeosphaeria nodorum (strain SN15 / ATCC MYA-4574 / FGSC 10173) TaxID=321614 RepID=A0A7U2F5T5_PHANO|nr:hypothetical protein HBH56_233880 [Parastagonospora nodorum]QRC97040.1 hypothetical protein JI435_409990 [Parastagonospora nodorum SN15]KAH3921302.1 hypothetical protein HBH54_241940 [Parastagonospora nodorum]KAH3944505.1 hypothetical protein HBH53_158310 [Parastagonospora nodorum]KAH3959389.1 hypothetical protein HBH52_245110 [Parastagonospora nodorum]
MVLISAIESRLTASPPSNCSQRQTASTYCIYILAQRKPSPRVSRPLHSFLQNARHRIEGREHTHTLVRPIHVPAVHADRP